MERSIMVKWTHHAEGYTPDAQAADILALLDSEDFDVEVMSYSFNILHMLEWAVGCGKLKHLSLLVEATDTCYDYDPTCARTMEDWQKMCEEL
jgi:hypothetical protein